MTAFTEGALLREVARVQHDKTLQAVRDLCDSIGVHKIDGYGMNSGNRSAQAFRADLITGLKQLRDREATP